jgi:hypothetical protein
MLTTFPNQKKNKRKFLSTLQLTQFPFQFKVQAQETFLKKKKERERLVTFPNQKKKKFPPFNSPFQSPVSKRPKFKV